MRRRKNKRTGNSEAAKLSSKISATNLEKRFNDTLKYQKDKSAQSEYLSALAEIERDVLSRSIFVTQVKDLKREENCTELKRFFEANYGRVEECVTAQFSGKKKRNNDFPPARIRFVRKQDAEKIFGKELLLARREASVDIAGCLVAHGNAIKVRPSDPYPKMADQAITGNCLELRAEKVAMGHWFSAGEEDSYSIVGQREGEVKNSLENLWLEETVPNCSPSMRIDLRKRAVEIELHSNDIDPLGLDRLRAFLSMVSKNIIYFRFKDLLGPIEFFPTECALFFRLKHPPKLYKVTEGDRDDRWDREIQLCEIDTGYFGGCLGYKLTLDRSAGSRLQANREANEELQMKIMRIRDFKSGLLLRALIDNGSFCWYHALHDKACGSDSIRSTDLLDLINKSLRDVTCRVLQQMRNLRGQTQFPASVFSKLALLDRDNVDAIDAILPSHCVELPRVLLTPTKVAVVGLQVEMSNRVTLDPTCAIKNIRDDTFRCQIKWSNLQFSGLFVESIERAITLACCSTSQPLSFKHTELDGRLFKLQDTVKICGSHGQCFSTTVQTLVSSFEQAVGETQISVNDKLEDIVNYVGEKEMCHSDGTGLIRKELMTGLLKRLPFAPSDLSSVSIIQVRFGGAKGTLTAWDYTQLAAARRKTSARGGNFNVATDVHLRPSMVKFETPYRRLEVVSIGTHIPYYLNRNVILLLGVHGVKDELIVEMQRMMLDTLDKMLRDAPTAAEIVPRLSGPDSTLTAAVVQMVSAGLSPEKEPFLFSVLHAIRTHHLTNLRKKSRIFVKDGAVLIGGLDETGLVPEGCIFVQVQCGENNDYKPLVGPLMVTKHPVMHPGDVRMLLGVDLPELRGHKNLILFSQWGVRREADKMAGSDLDGDQFAVTWDSRLFLKEWNCSQRGSDGVWISRNGNRVSLNDWKSDVRCLEHANADPMDYSAPPSLPTDLDAPISDKHIMQHFVNHAISDNLGRIANMWLDFAAKFGAGCQECIELAELHSIAVDFPKSGVPVVVPKTLSLRRDEPRPHWRERRDVDSYHCRGVVGKLYDDVVDRGSRKVISDGIALAGRVTDQYGQILCFMENRQRSRLRIILEHVYQPHIPAQLGWNHDDEGRTGDTEILLAANIQRRDYDRQLMELMSKYHLHGEGELLTGCIRKYHRLNKRRRHDLCEEVKAQCKELRKNQRRLVFEEVLSLAYPQADKFGEEQYEELLMAVENLAIDKTLPEGAERLGFLHQKVREYARKVAAAMYMITYNPDMRVLDSSEAILFSFPWIVADVIAHGVDVSSAENRN